jgi:hypothetical protein
MQDNPRGRWSERARGLVRGSVTMLMVAALAGCVAVAGGIDDQAADAEAADAEAAVAVIEQFYGWYLHQTPQGAPLAAATYGQRRELTAELVARVQEAIAGFTGGGVDPFLCGQDVPGSVMAGEATVSGDEAVVRLAALYVGNPLASQLDVRLTRVEDGWRIAEISCSGEMTPLTAAQTAQSFYAMYLQSARRGSPLADAAYRDMPFLAPEFVAHVSKVVSSFEGGGYDPILCAQDVPDAVTAASAQVNGDVATVEMKSSFEGHRFTVQLAARNGGWLITGVTCR